MPVILLLAAAFATLLVLAPWIRSRFDAMLNATTTPTRSPVSDAARRLHDRLALADLHCDTLLWNRDLLRRASRGHVDLPRLIAGGVTLQVFAAANRVPLFSNYHRTPPWPDVMPALAVANHWRPAAWRSPVARMLAMAAALDAFVARADGALVPVRTRDDIDRLGPGTVGAVLLVEGLHGLHGDPAVAQRLFEAGFRIFGIAHMSDNGVGGAAHGWRRHGLTERGRAVVSRLDAMGGIIDLAHASERTIDDVLGLVTRPVVVSHTGLQAVCPGRRNVSDAVLERIAGRGGLVGVAFFPAAAGGRDAASVARAIGHAVRVGGVDHVALGSDFDGAVRAPFDAAGFVQLTDALLREGLAESDIEKIMGANARRFLRDTLPAAAP